MQSPCPRVSLFSLPKELSDIIYTLTLVTQVPIVVWHKAQGGRENRADVKQAKVYQDMTHELRQVYLALLRCHPAIASTAAAIFYGQNTFLFSGEWTWETVAQWLAAIGQRNCACVTRLELTMGLPSQAWQQATGERISIPYAWEPPYSRSPYLLRRSTSRSEGIVESIHPAIETALALLRRDRQEGWPGVTIQISLLRGVLPGFQLRVEDISPFSNYFSLDLPNLLETLSSRPLNKGEATVTVLWAGLEQESDFNKNRGQIEEIWEILKAVPEDFPLHPLWDGTVRKPWKMIRFLLRRKPILEQLWAAEPSPYSWYRSQGYQG